MIPSDYSSLRASAFFAVKGDWKGKNRADLRRSRATAVIERETEAEGESDCHECAAHRTATAQIKKCGLRLRLRERKMQGAFNAWLRWYILVSFVMG
jgi:hypothetical protein